MILFSESINIPEKVTKKLGMNRLRTFVNGQNLLTFADFTLGDPERNAANESIIAYPIAKYALNNERENLAFEIIEEKIHQSLSKILLK